MSQNSPTSPLDEYRELITRLAEDPTLTNVDIVRQLPIKTSDTALRRAMKRWGVVRPQYDFEKPGTKIKDGEAWLTSTPLSEVKTPEELMEDRGLDPEDWEIISMTVNEWEGSPTKGDQKKGKEGNRLYRQLKIHLRRKREIQLIAPAEASDYRRAKVKAPKLGESGQLVVFTGDQQAPFHDVALHQEFCAWLRYNQPAKGVLIGDTVDFPDISRHRLRPEGTATVQECINSGYNILRDYVEASPETEWIKLCGNHDERIRNTLIDWTMELYGIKRAEVEGHDENSVLSIDHLLRLDELGIHYLDPAGSYEHAQVQISPYLAARHGWLATKGSGTSALKTLEHLGYSIIVGHTHRQSLVFKTTHDIHGQPTTVAGVETGCMCRIEEGLGYAVAPDWQNGFATAHIWRDGKFKIDLATYVSDQLLWRDQRYG
jgi:hypothetical protein